MKSKHFMFNAMLLAVASILAKVIGAFYRIPLTKILGESGIGLYQLAFPIYSFILVLVTGGIGNAITKLTACYYKEGNTQKIKKLIKVSFITISAVSIFMIIILYCLAGPIANIQHEPNLTPIYFALAPCFFICAMATLTKSYYAGKENMIPGSLSQLIENITKLVFGLIFAYLLIPKGLIYGVFGAILGVLVSEIFGTIFLLCFALFSRKKNKTYSNNEDMKIIRAIASNGKYVDAQKCPESKKNIKDSCSTIFKELVKLAIPLTINGAIVPLIFVIDSLVAIKFFVLNGFSINTATENFGLLYGVINSLVNMPVVIAVAIGVALMPSITSVFKDDNKFLLKGRVKEAFNYTFLIAIPFVVIFAILSPNIIRFLYGGIFNKPLAQFLLCISSISVLSLSLVQVSSSILIGINHFWWQVFTISLSCILKIIVEIVLGYLGILTVEILSIINVCTFALAAILNIIKIKNVLNINFLKDKNKFVFALSVALMWLTYYLTKLLAGNSTSFVFLIIAGGAMFTVYCVTLILFKIVNIKTMFQKK